MADFISTWADAIAQYEGFNSPSSRPARNHNPGDLKYAGQPGAVAKDAGGFAIFADDATGFDALYRQLQKYVADFPGYSILQITAHYLGQHLPEVNTQGNAFAYANYVASRLGVEMTTTLAELTAAAVTDTAPDSTPPAPDQSGGGGSTPGGDMGDLVGIGLLLGALILWALGRAYGT